MSWSINDDNGGGGGTAVWDKCRSLWNNAGIAEFPWKHVRSMADLQRLISVGEAKNSPAIGVNIEDVVGDKLSLQQVSGYLLDFWVNRYEKPVHMPTLSWVQNQQGWQYMSFAVAALEIFPDENYPSTKPQDCIDHALAEGLTKVTLMFKTKGFTPASYGNFWTLCHSLYTADDITPTAPAWNIWKAPTPCTAIQGDTMLTPNQKKEFRAEIVSFTKLAEQYEHRWHYDQRRPFTGIGAAPQTYHVDDCSAYCSLVFYWAARHTQNGVRVADPLDYHYSGYGNTQSAYEYLRAHKAPKDKYRIGDMAIYGTTSKTVHMTVCRKAGTAQTAIWSSFGQEAGPEPRQPLGYHPAPLVGVYRHPALL